MVPFARDAINRHDLRVQVVGQRDDWEQERQDADHGDGFKPRVVARIPARRDPAETPEPNPNQRNSEPNKIKNCFHYLEPMRSEATTASTAALGEASLHDKT